jgi:hypothetical protein
MNITYTIDDCRRLAASLGGRCLSSRYVDVHTKLDWACAEGHRWQAQWDRVNRLRRWCPACARARARAYTIADMRAFASARGGDCLSDVYVNGRTMLRWRCEQGHTWDAPPKNVLGGAWCATCVGQRPWTLDRAMKLARSRGGECLGETEKHRVYRWRCVMGHRWTADGVDVQAGNWCAACAANKPLTIADLQRTARKRGGRCLAEKYLGTAVKVEWECRKGHRWTAKPASVRGGSWCPECSVEQRRRPRRLIDIHDMQKAARERGGKCLSSYYVPEQKLLWECADGHRWRALGTAVRYGRWCAQCAGLASPTIEDLQALAADLGGECLSTRYRGTHRKLWWQCGAGHTFRAAPSSVKAGRFCPECRPRKPGTIAELKAIAAERGGKCLSRRYVNAHTHVEWSCSAGHRWRAVPASVKSGTWCPQCARRGGARSAKLSLEARARRQADREHSSGRSQSLSEA